MSEERWRNQPATPIMDAVRMFGEGDQKSHLESNYGVEITNGAISKSTLLGFSWWNGTKKPKRS